MSQNTPLLILTSPSTHSHLQINHINLYIFYIVSPIIRISNILLEFKNISHQKKNTVKKVYLHDNKSQIIQQLFKLEI